MDLVCIMTKIKHHIPLDIYPLMDCAKFIPGYLFSKFHIIFTVVCLMMWRIIFAVLLGNANSLKLKYHMFHVYLQILNSQLEFQPAILLFVTNWSHLILNYRPKYKNTSVVLQNELMGTSDFFLNGTELSLNSRNLINHRSMNWAQFIDPVSHMCIASPVVASSISNTEGGRFEPFK